MKEMAFTRVARRTMVGLGMGLAIILACLPQKVDGQCQSYISDRGACFGDTLSSGVCCFIGGIGPFSYYWYSNSGLQILSGQGTPNVTFRIVGANPCQLFCVRYDAGANCTVAQESDYWLAGDTYYNFYNPISDCPNSSLLDTVAVLWNKYPQHGNCNHVAWTAMGGTIVWQRRVSQGVMSMLDTLVVQWGGSGAQGLQATAHVQQVTWGNGYCYYDKYFWPSGGGATITGPTVGCDTTTNRVYSVPASANYAFAWTATNGTILSGQGTNSVSVRWHGTGSLNVVKTGTTCSTVYTGSLNFTFGAVNPLVNLGPNDTVCGSTVLNPGTYSTYAWNTGSQWPTLNVTSSGTYSVTVTNQYGCTDRDSITVTVGTAPAPNLGPNQTVCIGTAVTLNPGSYLTYAWSTGATSPTISPSSSGIYSVTVADVYGCTGTDTVNVTFLPLPNFNLGNDSFICADTSLLISGPSGMTGYLWSNGAVSSNIMVTGGGTYALTVTDGNGCTASDGIVITGLTDCVFPGDANYDGVADNVDVLSIGAYYGFSGAIRPGATLQWYGQNVTNWGGALPGQADPKHSDCNGDGVVAAVDTLAVTLNYGQTHTKSSGATGGGAALWVRALQDTILPGAPAWFVVELGDAQSQADSVYGLAFQLNYSGGAVASPGMYTVDYTNCWFAPAGNRVDFTYNPAPLGDVDMAVVRTDQNNQTGYGEVCRFAISTDSNLVPQQDRVVAMISHVTLVHAELGPQAVAVFGDSVVVSHPVTGSVGGPSLVPPRIYPNPAENWVRVEALTGKLEGLDVLDLSGRRLKMFRDGDEREVMISTVDLPAGTYVLRVSTDHGVYFHRLVVVH
jgi:hypothetical protein